MFEMLKSLVSPKKEFHLVIRGRFTQDMVYMLQNQVNNWGFPGRLRVQTGVFELFLEGRQAMIESKLKTLLNSPVFGANVNMVMEWNPYQAKFKFFTITY
jgi:hypothetical protein